MTVPFDLPAQLDRRYRLLLTVASLVIIAAGVRAAASVLDSLLLALLLTVAVLPVFERLRARGVSNGIAITLTTVLLVAVALALLGFVGVAGTRLVQVLPGYEAQVDTLRQGLEARLLARGIEPDKVLSLDLINPSRALGLAASILSGAGKVLSQALFLVLIVAFILVEAGARRRGGLHPTGRLAVVSGNVRQYLVITTATGLGFSLAVYILMLAVGTDLPLVWAVLAFVMNFVPSIGIVLSLLPPVLLTLLESGWQRAVVILVGFIVFNFIVDNLIKPRFMQSGLDLSPLMGLLSLVVWSFLLGPVGALVALPLTIALRGLLQDAPPGPPPAAPEPPPLPPPAPLDEAPAPAI